jgi:hypothetical protein
LLLQEVLKRLRLEKEMDLAKLTIHEVEEQSSPDSPQVFSLVSPYPGSTQQSR